VVLNVTDWHLCSCSIEVVKPRVLLPVGEMTLRHHDVAVLDLLRFVLHSSIVTVGIECVLFYVFRRNTEGLEAALQATVNHWYVFCCCHTRGIITMIICETVWGMDQVCIRSRVRVPQSNIVLGLMLVYLANPSGHTVWGLDHGPLTCWAYRLEFRGLGRLSVAIIVWCKVEVSASGWSLFQSNPTDCCRSECDREFSIMRRH